MAKINVKTIRRNNRKTIERLGGEWRNEHEAWLGDLAGTVQTGTPGVLYARLLNGNVVEVHNGVNAPAVFDLHVRIGENKHQRKIWQIIRILEDYDVPAGGGHLAYHHEQHMFDAPDMLPVNRKQIMSFTAIVSNPDTFEVTIYGGYGITANGLRLLPHQTVDLSSYVPDGGAVYINIEVDDEMDLTIHEGSPIGSREVASETDIPVPDAGKYILATVLLSDGQTTLPNSDISVPMPINMVPKSTGMQINDADPGTPEDPDKFPYWSIFHGALKTTTWANIKSGSSISVLEADISNPPTEAEITSLIGGAVWRGAGYNAFIRDTTTDKPLYWFVSDGSRWHFFALTKSVYESADYITFDELDAIDAPSPDIYTAGMDLGNLTADPGLELVMASGATLTTPPYLGRVTAFDSEGNTIWTFETPDEQFGMLTAIADVNGDGYNEVAATFNEPDGVLYLLDRDGIEIWHYDMVGGGYARGIAIGMLHPDYTNPQIVVGGYNGQFALLDSDGNEIWQQSLGGSVTVQSIRIADIDEDDQNEIVIAFNRSVRAYNYLGTQIWNKTLGDTNNDIISVDVGNVTGDAGLEILATARPRLGVGSIRGAYLLDSSGNELWHWDPPSGNGCEGAMLEDLDGDGIDEVIVGWGNHPDGADPGGVGHEGGITILDSTGAELGTWIGTETVEFFVWGDVNNDGVPELVASGSDGQAHIFRVILAHDPDESNIGRLTAYEDTKANAEAFAGSLSEIMFAHATDTDEIGFLINGTWTWLSSTPPTIGQYRQFTYVVSGGDFSFIIDADGKPVMALQDLE